MSLIRTDGNPKFECAETCYDKIAVCMSEISIYQSKFLVRKQKIGRRDDIQSGNR